jgi:hypothetical protein
VLEVAVNMLYQKQRWICHLRFPMKNTPICILLAVYAMTTTLLPLRSIGNYFVEKAAQIDAFRLFRQHL